MKTWMGLLFGLCLPAMMLAPGRAVAKSPVLQASMVVTGVITLNSDGGVQGYVLHDPDKLPPVVVQLIKTTVATWRFAPVMVNGHDARVQTGMFLRVVAEQHADKRITATVAAIQFGCQLKSGDPEIDRMCASVPMVHPVPTQRRPPNYPVYALRNGVGGEVFLVLAVDRNGNVVKAAASQVNLFTLTDSAEYCRQVLADAVLSAARYRVRIDHERSAVESLNVAMAATLCLFEHRRQRRQG